MVISNASPLICLARIDKLNLLKKYFGRIFVPKEVYQEICVKGEKKPGSTQVQSAEWIKIKEVKDKFAVELLELELKKGEAEVIVLAKELKAKLVLIDEKIPREKLNSLGFNTLGSVGVLIKAAKEGQLNLKQSLDELRKKGFWLSEDIYKQALKEA